jgi:predicted RNA-binding Zn-ribbon protein involved in translation (DUF1610 family)
MDNDTPFTCQSCDFQFGVIWCYNWEASQGERQVNYCPRCGEQTIVSSQAEGE